MHLEILALIIHFWKISKFFQNIHLTEKRLVLSSNEQHVAFDSLSRVAILTSSLIPIVIPNVHPIRYVALVWALPSSQTNFGCWIGLILFFYKVGICISWRLWKLKLQKIKVRIFLLFIDHILNLPHNVNYYTNQMMFIFWTHSPSSSFVPSVFRCSFLTTSLAI